MELYRIKKEDRHLYHEAFSSCNSKLSEWDFREVPFTSLVSVLDDIVGKKECIPNFPSDDEFSIDCNFTLQNVNKGNTDFNHTHKAEIMDEIIEVTKNYLIKNNLIK